MNFDLVQYLRLIIGIYLYSKLEELVVEVQNIKDVVVVFCLIFDFYQYY